MNERIDSLKTEVAKRNIFYMFAYGNLNQAQNRRLVEMYFDLPYQDNYIHTREENN